MGRLEIKLLGPFQASLDGDTLSGFDSDKVRALLAYLAVEADQPHRRERLAGLLWPDWPERSARTNLRSALANLRKVIGDHDAQPPFLLITRQTIQFNPASDSWLDVARLRALSANRSSGAADIDQLEEAIDLYKGNFLEGFSIPDSIPFEEWSLMMRQSLQGQALRALHHLAGYYQQTGAYEQALGFARQQIEMDAYQESAHQQVMWIQAQSGRRNEALRHYEGFRDLLEEELGVEPLESTQQMYMQL
jgi:DNA-binding SARP family transcriptional activator